jgi:acyl carrier protein phosphodiesterase
MNYLAHAFLSFNNADLLVGNMIADYIKGNKQFDYSNGIQAGIKLHRAIDFFTDTHEASQEIKNLFKPTYRLYAGAFIDVVYDYFLANDTVHFTSENELRAFANNTYEILEKRQPDFPEKFGKMFPFMQSQDWLYNYRTDIGMQKSFGGLRKRAKYIEETETAFQIFLDNKKIIQESYDAFFPALKNFALNKSTELLKG